MQALKPVWVSPVVQIKVQFHISKCDSHRCLVPLKHVAAQRDQKGGYSVPRM